MLVCPLALPAQVTGWQYLPNAGLPTPIRFEDVYFTDTFTGYAVYISNSSGLSTLPKPIYKTTDGGISWSKIGPTLYGSSSLRSIEFLSDNVTGIVGSLNGTVYRTPDGGSSWSDITASITDTLSDSLPAGSKKVCGIAHSGNSFYCVGWWGSKVAHVFKSTDKGVTWSTAYIDTNLATGLVDAAFISADTGFVTGGRNFSLAGYWGASSDESVILKTTDGGLTWTKVFSDTTIGGRIWKIQLIDRQHIVASVEPYYYPDSVNMVRSADGGNTWTMIHAGRVYDSVSAYQGGVTQGIGFATSKIGWLGGYYSGIFQTLDGGVTWDTLHFGTTFNRIFVIDSNHAFAGGAAVYKWTHAPDTVSHVSAGTVTQPHILYKVSPNPATGVVKIEFDIRNETNVVLQVANVGLRRQTQLASGRFPPGHYTYCWDGRNMPSGSYLVWLGTDEVPLTQKFVLVW